MPEKGYQQFASEYPPEANSGARIVTDMSENNPWHEAHSTNYPTAFRTGRISLLRAVSPLFYYSFSPPNKAGTPSPNPIA